MICLECNDTAADCLCDILAKPRMTEELVNVIEYNNEKLNIIHRVLDGHSTYYVRLPNCRIITAADVDSLLSSMDSLA